MAKGVKASRGRRGLHKPSPELIAQAQDQTAATITRIMLTFVALALFCLLSLLTPDAALVVGGERLDVPFAGPVSFLGFMIVGPLTLIALRVYLQIYVEHWRRLDPIRRQLKASSAPTLAPLANPLLRGFAEFVLFLLLPLTMLAFTLKAAVLPAWGSGLLCVTIAVFAGHLMLPLRRRWRLKALLSGGAAMLLAAALAFSSDWPVHRPANLFRADLADQWLPQSDLRGAYLVRADLAGANLDGADLEHALLASANLEDANLDDVNLERAGLWHANLKGADVPGANLKDAFLAEAELEGADLRGANLEGADLAGANLEGANLAHAHLSVASFARANLRGADLLDAEGLTQAQLDQACGDEKTKLAENLFIGPCFP